MNVAKRVRTWTWIGCLLHGHRPAEASAYEATTRDGREKRLHYCRECGQPVWVVSSNAARR